MGNSVFLSWAEKELHFLCVCVCAHRHGKLFSHSHQPHQTQPVTNPCHSQPHFAAHRTTLSAAESRFWAVKEAQQSFNPPTVPRSKCGKGSCADHPGETRAFPTGTGRCLRHSAAQHRSAPQTGLPPCLLRQPLGAGRILWHVSSVQREVVNEKNLDRFRRG